ncbi:hypothetical protein DEO72_LG8g1892 [Vigna unguiculata]|uniref:Ubiquitin-like protease family profile domain-containing protein n=1 Tax=Vigna unguiculata TaxID=3917 RepID=A0A4D6MR08_VIGUN|nr:hypothetical protein DEO72_LG8g1892 [Vigna unguiculata]
MPISAPTSCNVGPSAPRRHLQKDVGPSPPRRQITSALEISDVKIRQPSIAQTSICFLKPARTPLLPSVTLRVLLLRAGDSESHHCRIVGKPRGQQLKVIYPKCNKQEDSWECGYYVMSWIRTIIRAAVKDEWIENDIHT